MELNKRLKELSCRFHRIRSLEEYQEWKRDTIILISTIEDKDTLFKLLNSEKRNAVINAKIAYSAAIGSILTMVIKAMTSDLVDLLESKCYTYAGLLVLFCTVMVLACIHRSKSYDKTAQFYEECLDIISVLYGDKTS